MSWRTQQLQGLGGVVPQDEQLIQFIKQNNIKCMMLDGDDDVEYFQSKLPDCVVGDISNDGILVIFANQLFNKLEEILSTLEEKIQKINPDWVYVAINKYLVITDRHWDNLTDNYDQDLIDIVSDNMHRLGFVKIKQSYLIYDNGRHFNFAHPTTNVFYKKQS
jgi:hypothetical protein